MSFGPEISWPRMPPGALVFLSGALIWLCLRPRHFQAVWPLTGLLALAGIAWAQSARDRVHWAPSGDVFLERVSGDVTRIAFIDGDGLGPLQFSDVPVTDACTLGNGICRQKIGSLEIALVPLNSQPSCLSEPSPYRLILLGPAADPICSRQNGAQTVLWRDVVAENGITYERYGSRWRKREKAPCGRRPWRPCP